MGQCLQQQAKRSSPPCSLSKSSPVNLLHPWQLRRGEAPRSSVSLPCRWPKSQEVSNQFRNHGVSMCRAAAPSKADVPPTPTSPDSHTKLSPRGRVEWHTLASTSESVPDSSPGGALQPPLHLQPLPRHLAIILDGNHRWAARRSLITQRGHEAGVDALRTVVRRCGELGIPFLTVFAFSADNWNRPPAEVAGLLSVLETALRREVPELLREGAKVSFFGDLGRFSENLQALLQRYAAHTSSYDAHSPKTQFCIWRKCPIGCFLGCGSDGSQRCDCWATRLA
jgi:hypothetical protein